MKPTTFLLAALAPSILALPNNPSLAAQGTDPESLPTVDAYTNLTQITDEYLFHLSLEKFIAKRKKRNPPELDWSSDDCTSAPDNPLGFKFQPACQRHDFGIRNYKGQQRLDKTSKKAIDKNFRSE